MADASTTGEVRDIRDAFGAIYMCLPYDLALRQKQKANAINKGSYFHSLKIFQTFL